MGVTCTEAEVKAQAEREKATRKTEADKTEADKAAAEAARIREERLVLGIIEPIVGQGGYGDKNYVYPTGNTYFGSFHGENTFGFGSFIIPATTIEEIILNLNIEDTLYIEELSEQTDCEVRIESSIPPSGWGYQIKDGSIIFRSQQTGVMVNATKYEVSSFPCSELMEEMKIPFPAECINDLQGNDKVVIFISLSNPPLSSADEHLGSHLTLELSVKNIEQGDASTEAAQTETEAAGSIGMKIKKQEGYNVVDKVAPDSSAFGAGIQEGWFPIGINSEWLLNENFEDMFDQEDLAEKVQGEVGSEVTISFTNSGFTEYTFHVCTRQ